MLVLYLLLTLKAFILRQRSEFVFVLIFVDDILITRSSESTVIEGIDNLNARFALKILGPLSYFLGLEFSEIKIACTLVKRSNFFDLLKQTRVESCKDALHL